MSDNKSARRELERVFGKICMIEAAGIRYIPKGKRRKLKGYTKYDEQITYHHIHEKSKGGKATFENGALARGYNHRWLHSLPEAQKEEVNQKLIEFKISTLQAIGDKIYETSIAEIPLEFDLEEEFDIIPVFDTDRKKKFNRAKQKRAMKREIDEYYDSLDKDDEWER